MKEYTAEDCVKEEDNNNSRSFFFEHKDDEELLYEVKIESITLQLSEEIERQGGGTVTELAAYALNFNLQNTQKEQDIKDFFEEISD